MRKTILIFLALLFTFSSYAGWAADPNVTVNLSLNKAYYVNGEPIIARVTVSNPGGSLWVNDGFSSTIFHHELKVTDPAGRVLGFKMAAAPEPHGMYPVPQMLFGGSAQPAAPCEILTAGSLTDYGDIQSNFDFSLPGTYMAQVQVSMMVFQTATPAPAPYWCQLTNYLWQGVLESQVVSFYVEGKSIVKMDPPLWYMSPVATDVVRAQVFPDPGLRSIDPNMIYLNTVGSTSVVNKGAYLEATYSAVEALQSLGTGLQLGRTYPVRISGWTRTGGFFGGTGKVALTGLNFNGFHAPIDNLPVINNAKAGQTIPVKWRIIYTVGGGDVSDPISFTSLSSNAVSCSSVQGGPESPVEEYAAGSSGLQYLGGGEWEFAWKTPKTYANSCREMILTLKDGSTHKALFKFK
jgi:hypothetical protein